MSYYHISISTYSVIWINKQKVLTYLKITPTNKNIIKLLNKY